MSDRLDALRIARSVAEAALEPYLLWGVAPSPWDADQVEAQVADLARLESAIQMLAFAERQA